MEDWGAVKARMLNDAEEMDGNPVSFDKAAATGVAADIRAALVEIERLGHIDSTQVTLLEKALSEKADEVERLRGELAHFSPASVERAAALEAEVERLKRVHGEARNQDALVLTEYRDEMARLRVQLCEANENVPLLQSRALAADAKVERLREALNAVMPGLDDYWSQIPEGMAAIEKARAALRGGGE